MFEEEIMTTDTNIRKFYMDELEIKEHLFYSSPKGPYIAYCYNIGRNNYVIKICKTGEIFGIMLYPRQKTELPKKRKS